MKLSTNYYLPTTNKGQSLIELILVIGLFALVLPALFMGFMAGGEAKVAQSQRLEAVTLLTEAQEAVRVVREAGWGGFAVNGTYHPVISSNTWTFDLGSETINEFTRSIVVSDAKRDGSGAIDEEGNVDPSTKKVAATVSWTSPVASNVSSTMYVTRWQDSGVYEETSEDQFNFVGSTNPGEKTQVAVQATAPPEEAGDGEIVLDGGGPYETSGTFESQTFDPGFSVAVNRFSASFDKPSNTNLEYQVAVLDPGGDPCPETGSYTFVGPDGTSGTKFTLTSSEDSVAVPAMTNGDYANPGRCIRYKVFFTGDGSVTPVFKEATINYSP